MKKIVFLFLLSATCINTFANLTQSHWRWRNNDGTEILATWKAVQDSAISINNYNPFRLRMEVYNAEADNKLFNHGLQYATSTDGPWYYISDASEINAFIFAGNNSYIINNETTTQQLTGTQYAFVPGNVIINQSEISDSIISNTSKEYEWCIKPANNIPPNTRYYFKAASGDGPSSPPSLTTGSGFRAKPVYVSNGGFENNLANWSTATDNSSTATFSTDTSEHHTGAKALKVNVTNKSSTNSVKLIYKSKPAPGGMYLLRFWAIADMRNALLNVNSKTSAGDDVCTYKIYDRFDKTKNDWQMYQYAFKATASPVSLEFRFNSNTTYYLDDVEVIAFNDATTDVTTQYNWQYNQTGYGWLSGDNDNSVLLPDGSVAWIFSDSFLGFPNSHSNIIGSAPIINNLIVHEVNHQYTSIYGGTQASPKSLFSPGNGNIFWNSGGVVENNKLKVLLMEIGGGSEYKNNVYVGTLSLPDLRVEGKVKTSYHGPNFPNTIFQDGAYNYIYISERVGTFENYTQVARVPVGSLSSSTTQWEFYTNNNTWSTDYTKAKRILAGVEGASVVKLGPNNYAMSGVPNLSSEIAVWFAASPVGPWINKTVIYNIPSEEGVLPYEGHIDKGSGENGVYTLSHSIYPFSGTVPQQLSDKGIYIPYYVKVNLLALSPFTNSSKSGKADVIAATSSSPLNNKSNANK